MADGSERDLKQLTDFAQELSAERNGSGRTDALIVATIFEEFLRRILEEFMIDGRVTKDLLAPGESSPLGSFSAKIKLAEALGLITSWEARALNVVRQIRNEYAHRLVADISSDRMDSRIDLLVTITREQFGMEVDTSLPAKQRYIQAIAFILMTVNSRIPSARLQKRNPLI